MSTKTDSLDKLHQEGRAIPVDNAVLANITALGPICRDALCKAASILNSTACGAIDRLMKRGLVEEAGKVWNHTTRRNVKAYRAVGGC